MYIILLFSHYFIQNPLCSFELSHIFEKISSLRISAQQQLDFNSLYLQTQQIILLVSLQCHDFHSTIILMRSFLHSTLWDMRTIYVQWEGARSPWFYDFLYEVNHMTFHRILAKSLPWNLLKSLLNMFPYSCHEYIVYIPSPYRLITRQIPTGHV